MCARWTVSLLTIEAEISEMKVIAGDSYLVADDFDNRMVDFCMQNWVHVLLRGEVYIQAHAIQVLL